MPTPAVHVGIFAPRHPAAGKTTAILYFRHGNLMDCGEAKIPTCTEGVGTDFSSPKEPNQAVRHPMHASLLKTSW